MTKLIINTENKIDADYLRERAKHAVQLKGHLPFYTTNENILKIHEFVLSNSPSDFQVKQDGLKIQISKK